jgi:hypothetical protein
MCVHVGNQQSRGVVIARLQSSIQSLLHQHRDLYQSTYLYLLEDREPTSHHCLSVSWHFLPKMHTFKSDKGKCERKKC